MAAFWGRKFPISTSEQPCAHNQINKKMVLLTIPNLCDVFVAALGQIPAATVDRQSLSSGGGRALLAVRQGTDGRSLVTLTCYKAANTENEYSGAELAV